MKLTPTKCIKCGVEIIKEGKPLKNYRTLVFKRDVGDLLCIGVCDKCDISKKEYGSVVKAVVAFHGQSMKGNIIEYWGTDEDIVEYCESKGLEKMCAACEKPIEGSYIITSGKVMHEKCPKPLKPKKEPKGKYKAGSNSRLHNKQNPRSPKLHV